MIYNILGKDENIFAEELKKYKLLCILPALAALMLNAVLLYMRTPATHELFLALNIVTDILVGWFEIFMITYKLDHRKKLMRLYKKKSSSFCGRIVSLSEMTYRVGGLDCCKLTVEGEQTRVFFVPYRDGLTLPVGEQVTVYAVSNVITEVHA